MPEGVVWGFEAAQAEWIQRVFGVSESGASTSMVPTGFAAYARILHPAWDDFEERPLRWSEVAARNGLPVGAESQFPEIAFVPPPTDRAATWELTRPQEGALASLDAQALARILSRHTAFPEECWFGLWEGWPSKNPPIPTSVLDSDAESSVAVPEVIDPAQVAAIIARTGEESGWSPVPIQSKRVGPRVELGGEGYFMRRGNIDAVASFAQSETRPPQLWWPAEHAWCVATGIDAWWSYVGGTEDLIRDVVADSQLEAWRAQASDDPHLRLPRWLNTAVDGAVDQVMAGYPGRVDTSLGTVTVTAQPGCADVMTTTTRPDGSYLGQSRSALFAIFDPADHQSHQVTRERIRSRLVTSIVESLL